MTLPAPNLDDRRQEDIFAEARQLIPRYAREWTDWNESDPGITLVQLFAWMTDQTLFRLNQVPDRLYVKFLELLGLRLRPATPARTDLTFTLVETPPGKVPIAKGTRVAATPVGDEPPPVFETTRSIEAVGAELVAVRSWDGSRYRDHTDAASGPDGDFTPFGPVVRTDAALVLGFATDPPLPDVELNLLLLVPAPGGGPLAVACGDGTLPPPATIAWEGWDGHGWQPVALNEDETRAFTRSGYVRLAVRGDRLDPLVLTGDTEARRWLRARLVQSSYQRAPRLTLVRTNTVPAEQAQTVTGEVAGGTTGLLDQQLTLGSRPVVPGSLELEVDEGRGFVRWTQVDDFHGEGPDAAVYILDEASGTITFGGSEHGRPPIANPANSAGNVVARTYRYGGGPAGNVPAGAVTDLLSPIDHVDSVTNLVAAAGGRATETVAEARRRAPDELAAAHRAVTAADFEHFARTAPEATVGRAIARPQAHPDHPGVAVPGAVTVIVIPQVPTPAEAAARGERVEQAPEPTSATLRAVCAHLDAHRLVTTEVHATGPSYRDVRTAMTVVVDPAADLGAVRGAVDAALDRYFHPLWGGDRGTGWPLGGTIFYSLVVRTVIDAHEGVLRAESLTIYLDGRARPDCEDVDIGADELLRADGHEIVVEYAS